MQRTVRAWKQLSLGETFRDALAQGVTFPVLLRVACHSVRRWIVLRELPDDESYLHAVRVAEAWTWDLATQEQCVAAAQAARNNGFRAQERAREAYAALAAQPLFDPVTDQTLQLGISSQRAGEAATLLAISTLEASTVAGPASVISMMDFRSREDLVTELLVDQTLSMEIRSTAMATLQRELTGLVRALQGWASQCDLRTVVEEMLAAERWREASITLGHLPSWFLSECQQPRGDSRLSEWLVRQEFEGL